MAILQPPSCQWCGHVRSAGLAPGGGGGGEGRASRCRRADGCATACCKCCCRHAGQCRVLINQICWKLSSATRPVCIGTPICELRDERNTNRAVRMGCAEALGGYRRFARRASSRPHAVLILCLAACFPAGSLTEGAFTGTNTLPIAGASSAWSYTPLLAPGAPQASCAASSHWLCSAADAVSAVPDKLYQAAAAAGACTQLSAALEVWRCGGVLLAADTYTAVKSGQCRRSCAPLGVLPCAGAPAPQLSAALPLFAPAPVPGAGLCFHRASF